MIEYKWIKPPLSEYKQLLGIVGWTSVMAVSDETLRSAIDNSWHWVSVFDDGRLIWNWSFDIRWGALCTGVRYDRPSRVPEPWDWKLDSQDAQGQVCRVQHSKGLAVFSPWAK